MIGFIANRLIRSVVVIFLISVVTFTFMQLVPGGPFSADAGGRPRAPEIQRRLEAEYGLDRPPVEQYITYMRRLLFEFDFGPSLRQTDYDVNQIMFGVDFRADPFHAPVLVSAQIGLYSFLLAVAVGIPLGVLSALYRNRWADHVAMFITTFGVSVPNFVLGLMLILLFSLTLQWLPVFGWGESWKQAVMPVLTLGTGGMALIARLTRASVLEVLGQDYVRTARAKGVVERTVIRKHAFRNALLPIVTIIGLQLGTLFAGAVLTESIFGLAGVGRMLFESITARDYPVVQAFTIVIAVIYVFANLIVDLSYVFIDPRVKLN